MQRKIRGKKLNIREKQRNKRIRRKRAPGERPYAMIKQIFKSAHVLVTTLKRAAVKMIFTAISYNLQQLKTLKKTGIAVAV